MSQLTYTTRSMLASPPRLRPLDAYGTRSSEAWHRWRQLMLTHPSPAHMAIFLPLMSGSLNRFRHCTISPLLPVSRGCGRQHSSLIRLGPLIQVLHAHCVNGACERPELKAHRQKSSTGAARTASTARWPGEVIHRRLAIGDRRRVACSRRFIIWLISGP